MLAPAVTVTTARSFTVEYDDYDPNDVPADQAAPLPSYGISSTPDTLDTYGVASNSALADDYDPNDVPPDQVHTDHDCSLLLLCFRLVTRCQDTTLMCRMCMDQLWLRWEHQLQVRECDQQLCNMRLSSV